MIKNFFNKSFALTLLFQMTGICAFSQIIDVRLEPKVDCEKGQVNVNIWLKESQYSNAKLDLSTSSFLFNFDDAKYAFEAYTPKEFDGIVTRQSLTAGWEKQVLKNNNGLLSLVLLRERLLESNYKITHTDSKLVGTFTFNRLTDEIIRSDFLKLNLELSGFYGADNQEINTNLTYAEMCNDGRNCTLNDGIDIACNCAGDIKGLVNFDNTVVTSFDYTQDLGTAEVFDEGNTIMVTGNGWKGINVNYKITPNTLLEFEFKSDKIAEIHGIGLTEDNSFIQNQTFVLAGSQNLPRTIKTFKDYSGSDYKSYLIPVGEYFTGNIQRLSFFADDDDGDGSSNSYFKGVRIFEDGECFEDFAPPTAPKNLMANNITTSSLVLNWLENPENEAVKGYYIYNGANTQPIATVNENLYDITNLIPNESYQFSVAAYDAAGNISEKSDLVQVVLLNTCDRLNLNTLEIASFGIDQDNGEHTIAEDGYGISITKNAWKAIPYNYTITPNTILEFRFKSDQMAEYHSIGMSNNNSFDKYKSFKLYGTQNIGGDIKDYNTYSGTDYVSYSIPIGQYYTGSVNKIFITADSDEDPLKGASSFKDLRVYEIGSCQSQGCDAINFATTFITSYGLYDDRIQDRGEFEVLEDGKAIKLTNNAWKSIPKEYNITPNTLLEFEFKSDQEGEYHVIGMDNNIDFSPSRGFKLYGSQIVGGDVDDFDTYSGTEYVSYLIPIGRYYMGEVDRIFFVADNDNVDQGTSYFRNVRVYEDGDCSTTEKPVLTATDITSNSFNLSWSLADNPRIKDYLIYEAGQANPLMISNKKTAFLNNLIPGKRYYINVVPQTITGKLLEPSEVLEVALLSESCITTDFTDVEISSYGEYNDRIQDRGSSKYWKMVIP